MAELQKERVAHQPHLTGPTILYASLAGIAIGGPLLGMMFFTFLATITTLLISFPLLVIFSPLILSAIFIIFVAIAGFAAAGAMALMGIYAFAQITRRVRERRSAGATDGPIVEKLNESDQKVKEQANDWAGYFQHKVRVQLYQ
ncbi:oleosin S1-2 [Magnolia sinica]|uniref:oleosin S1-2 n=1 Tax=Magnolia sinica TaxID=86752 RepID=UPI00265A2BCC|nr:oleosin S1-2 [Magnolia sinica]